jgi:hypothetical protein
MTKYIILFRKYYIFTVIVGCYIYGYETSIVRDRRQDTSKFFQYTLGAPIIVPYYIYKNGIPRHD